MEIAKFSQIKKQNTKTRPTPKQNEYQTHNKD